MKDLEKITDYNRFLSKSNNGESIIGYGRNWRLIYCVTLMAGYMLCISDNVPLAELWTAPIRAVRKTNPIPTDEKSLARGKFLYVQGCVPCHGVKGKGDGPSAFSLNPKPADHSNPKMWDESDGSLFWKITTGRGAMPTWEEVYSEEDRWNLVNYVRTLAPSKTSNELAKRKSNP